jgi:hypothetical protein
VSIGRTILAIIFALALAALIYTGVWHLFTLFIWQHPMLSWLPILALIAVGFLVGTVRSLTGGGGETAAAPPAPTELAGEVGAGTIDPAKVPAPSSGRLRFAFGWGFLAGLFVLMVGLFYTLISPPAVGLDDIDYEIVETLPARTQPRLLPRSGVDDDPKFRDASEIHLTRDPDTGELMWTGEWQSATLGGPSAGVSVKPLDDVVSQSEILLAGFDHSVGGITPNTLKGKAKRSHPFSRIQYPVLIPEGEREAIAMAPYVGYRGFPFRTPYLKGVLVYHQDGTIEDLTPEEAADRPELVHSGRIFPESVARAQADALARSDELEGEIVDAEDNKQPYLTAIDKDTTAWVTIVNDKARAGGVKAIIIADSSTGETDVWLPSEDDRLVSTEDVINMARALPLKWEEERCCDSDGHSYTVTLREVVEPRLAFKDGKPYYLVTVVPTDDLALGREVEFTLLIDAETGEKLDEFDHVNQGVSADARLQLFFSQREAQGVSTRR